MSKTRVIYPYEAVYVGPAPSTGYHFIDVDGNLNDNHGDNLNSNINLLFPLYRIQSIQYAMNVDRQDIQALGRKSYVHNAIIEHPTVQLNFDYLQHGIINELRLGFYANYYHDQIGTFYPNNTGINLISGFTTRDFDRPSSSRATLQWPRHYRDRRNIFVAVNDNPENIKDVNYGQIDPDSPNYHVYGFGNCYINGYSTNAAVGSFPRASVSYICDNMSVDSSGSGATIPAMFTDTAIEDTSKHYIIPPYNEGSGQLVGAIAPGDITMSITSTPKLSYVSPTEGTGLGSTQYSTVENLGVNFSDIKIQGYNINLDLSRQDLKGLGHELAVDRQINEPTPISVDVASIVGESRTGSFADLLSLNDDYNIEIKLNNPVDSEVGGTAIQHNILRAKLASIDYGLSIGSNKVVNLGFVSEFDFDNGKGLFTSGQLGISATGDSVNYDESCLLWEDGGEDGQQILWDDGDDNCILIDEYIILY